MFVAMLSVAALFIVAIFGAHFQNGNMSAASKKNVSEPEDTKPDSSENSNPDVVAAGDNTFTDDKSGKLSQGSGENGNGDIIGAGEVLPLQISYDVDSSENGVMIMIDTNLPDGVELSAEITNIDAIKKEIGLTNNSQYDSDKYSMLIERTFNEKTKDFVKNGRAYFKFPKTPKGELSLTVTMPVLKLQSAAVREILGEKGENLIGDYVVYLSEFDDKTIYYNSTFLLE